MKRKFAIASNVIITFILTLLGVGCDNEENRDMPLAYGTPQAYHTIKGTVKGVNNTKIEGIGLTVSIIFDDVKHMIDSTGTDSLGRYIVYPAAFPDDTTRYILSFKDIDGEKNGSYLDKTEEVIFLRSELEGGEGWNSGSATKELNVELVAKTEEDEL